MPMIEGPNFVWMHLPKTGGTSMNRLIRELHIPNVIVDPDQFDQKHDSIALREQKSNWRVGTRQRFVTARRLTSWLISDWQHKRRHMGVPDLDFEPVRYGLFYSFRLGGTWVAADWWLQYFDINNEVQALRLERLQDDLNSFLHPKLPKGTPSFALLPSENAKPDHLKKDEPQFTDEDFKRILHSNPKWASWEKNIYGDNLKVIPISKSPNQSS